MPRVVHVESGNPGSASFREEPTSTTPMDKRAKRDAGADGGADGDAPLFVSFDVYMPQSGFSKNKMSKPDFSLLILSADAFMPSIAALRRTISSLDPAVPLRMSVVGDSSITFVEVSDFNLSAASDRETDLKKTS